MEAFSAKLAICAGNSPVNGEFPAQRPVTLSFDVFFDPRLNTWLSKQLWGWWFDTPSCPLWCHSNEVCNQTMKSWSCGCFWHRFCIRYCFVRKVSHGCRLRHTEHELRETLTLLKHQAYRWKGCSCDLVVESLPLTDWIVFMMTSSNGNIFRVTGPLCEEFAGHRWIPLTKASDAELWCFFFIYTWINDWVNNREAGDFSWDAIAPIVTAL